MSDALDNLKPCPICGMPMMISWEGLYCPPCDYTYLQQHGETLIQTAEHYNADYERIVQELIEGGERP